MTGRGARVRAGALSISAKKRADVQSVTAKKPPNTGKLLQDSHAVAVEGCYNCGSGKKYKKCCDRRS